MNCSNLIGAFLISFVIVFVIIFGDNKSFGISLKNKKKFIKLELIRMNDYILRR